MKKWKKLLWAVVALVLLAIIAHFVQRREHRSTVYQMFQKEGNTKVQGELLMISGVLNSKMMATGVLCVEDANQVTKVDLFMPDMGHGSQPPKVTPTSLPEELSGDGRGPHFGCLKVESMQLFMPGLWQMRVFYQSGAVGLFNLDVKR